MKMMKIVVEHVLFCFFKGMKWQLIVFVLFCLEGGSVDFFHMAFCGQHGQKHFVCFLLSAFPIVFSEKIFDTSIVLLVHILMECRHAKHTQMGDKWHLEEVGVSTEAES